MKILVTGSEGQLGCEMRNVLERVVPGVTDYVDIKDLDLTDAESVKRVLSEGGYTHVVNCAAYTAVDLAENDGKTMCYAVNVDAVENLALAASENEIKLVHISTDYVFDGCSFVPYKESDKTNPLSHYGTSKRKGEMAILSLCPDSIVIRTAWLYSPYGKNFVKTILTKGKEGQKLRVVADQIGSPTYARDLAVAIVEIIQSRQWIPGIYHFTNEGICSWYDFACHILEMAGIGDYSVEPVATSDYPTAAPRPAYSVLDKTLIKRTYGVKPPYWADSLKDCLSRLEQ